MKPNGSLSSPRVLAGQIFKGLDVTTVSPPRLVTSRPVLAAILIVAVLLAIVTAVLFQAPGLLGREKVLTDFDAFHIAGTLAAHGQASSAYQASEMMAEQRAITGTSSFMPWTYPPPYTLLMEGLASLPVGTAYLLFVSTSFLFYLAVLRRISGAYLPGVLIAIAPSILLIIRSGQNGFLTAALVGAFLVSFRNKQGLAGIPLGLMCVKPHLAVGIALLALLDRRWKTMAVAGVIASAAMLIATVAFGITIWAAFFGGLREASQFLAAGYYQLFRMSSAYAFVKSLGGSAEVALALHIVVAVTSIAVLVQKWRSDCSWRILASTTCTASLLISPYNYDYDLAILGVAIAFALPDIISRCQRYEIAALLALTWITTGYGLAVSYFLEDSAHTPISALNTEHWPSLTAPALLLLAAVSLALLRRRAGQNEPIDVEPRSHIDPGKPQAAC